MSLEGGAPTPWSPPGAPAEAPRTLSGRIFLSCGIFGVLLAIFAASPVATPFDSRWAVHTAMSFVHGHGGDLSEYRPVLEQQEFYAIEFLDGRPRTIYPIGASLLAVPVVAISGWVRPTFTDDLRTRLPIRTEQFIASIIGAAAGVIFFWVILGQFQSWGIAVASTFIFCFCTSMWSTATRALWQHGPLVLMLTIAMLLLARARRRPELIQYAGLPLAMAFVIRPAAAVPIVVLSSYVLLYYRAWLPRYLCWAMAVAIPWLAYNFVIYGGLLPPYYYSGGGAFAQEVRFAEGLLGNLLSPSRGLFVFSPVLLFAFSGFFFAMRDPAERPLNIAYGVIIVGHSVMIGAVSTWWAGHSFGPRYMTDIVPFLAYFTAFNFRLPAPFRPRAQMALTAAIAVVALASLLIHAQGALRPATLLWNSVPNNIDQNTSRAWDWSDPQFARTEAGPRHR